MVNMFDVQQKSMHGKVVVRTRQSNLVKGAVIQHVVRNTSDDAVVISTMTEHTDIVKAADMVTVMSAFVSAVKDIVAHGNAVRVSGLGTFYLTARETEEGESDFDIAFTADKSLVEAAKTAKPELTLPSESKPAIENVQDVDTMVENDTVSAGNFVILKGKRMRVAGEAVAAVYSSNVGGTVDGLNCTSGGTSVIASASEATPTGGTSVIDGQGTTVSAVTPVTGIFMAPCDEYDNYKTDRSDWVRVEDKDLRRNFMTEVSFRVPQIAGRYRIVIATKAPLNGSTRADKLLKHERVGVSMAVTVV